MQSRFIKLSAAVGAVLLILLGNVSQSTISRSAQATAAATQSTTPESTPWEVFASGLKFPRGLEFGPDGALYVAEAGEMSTGGTTPKDCQQVPIPVGPYTGGKTSRISKITPDGKISTVIDGLPSTSTSPIDGGDVSGVSDVAFLDDTLYASLAGAGCSHGNKGTNNGILRIDANGKSTQIADLSSFFKANKVTNPLPLDFEPDGDIYSMVQAEGNFYIVEANHGELDEITPAGKIRRVVDISKTQGHSVPTALAYRDGNFYVGNLSIFLIHKGIARILKITPKGEVTVLSPHLTAVLGLAFDKDGTLYALETTTVDNALPVPGTGDVVRVDLNSTEVEVVVSGLTFPTAMTFGPDGMLYISNFGFGGKPGDGQIVRVAVPPKP